jgi:hypothetical protein
MIRLLQLTFFVVVWTLGFAAISIGTVLFVFGLHIVGGITVLTGFLLLLGINSLVEEDHEAA